MGIVEFYMIKLYRSVKSLSRPFWTAAGFCFLAAAMIILLWGGDVSTFPVGWEKSFPITPAGISAKNVRMSARGNYIAAVYEGFENRKSGIFVSISFAAGKKFFKPVNITSDRSEIEMNPTVSISGKGRIAVSWQRLVKGDPESRIYYSISEDMGAVWSEPRQINLPSEMAMLPQALYDDRGGLHIFYNAYRDRAFNLFHVMSVDGKIFTKPERLMNISGLRGVFFPALHSSGPDIFIVIQAKGDEGGVLTDDLYFVRSGDYGDDWSGARKITSSKAQDSTPAITFFNGVIYLVYQNNENGSWAVNLLRGYDKGSSWDREPSVISTTNADCFSPVAAVPDDGDLSVIWYDIRERKPGIFSRKFPMRDGKPGREQRLSRSNVSARKPAAAAMGRSVIVLWEESGRIMAKSSDVYASPPAVYSETHPEDEWSRSSKAVIKWTPPDDESGITGYATMIKRAPDYKLPDLTPTLQNVDGRITKMVIPDLEDGISHFYIRAIDGAGNYSRTVRYRIQVSGNPPPMPAVTSSTHPEATGVDNASPEFEWSVDKRAVGRLKGFLYGISKNKMKTPTIFTEESRVSFQDLEAGRYFFSLRSVDKTNMMSRAAIYEIIVGSAPEIDASTYGKIARRIEEEKPPVKQPAKRRRPGRAPSIEIVMPFDESKPYNLSYFEAGIKIKNLIKENVVGYSVVADKNRREVPERINQREDIIRLADLENGEYYLGARCMYQKIVNGKNILVWTKPAVKKFIIAAEVPESAALTYLDGIMKRIGERGMAVPVSMMMMVFSLAAFGYGSRIVFYSKLIRLKIGNMFKSF